jgi:glycosyltransferase involved in cell wall biosynthesis
VTSQHPEFVVGLSPADPTVAVRLRTAGVDRVVGPDAPGPPVDHWLAAGPAAYEALTRSGVPAAELADRVSVYQPGDVETTSVAVLDLQQAAARKAGRAVPYTDWTPACERWQAALRPAPPAPPARPPGPPRVALLLPVAFLGGVWEVVRSLVRRLGERMAADPAAPRLTLVVAPDQDLTGLDAPGLPVERLGWDIVPRYRVTWDHDPAGLPPAAEFLWPRFPGLEATDALFFLTDRFARPLVPGRPYAVWVYDMIQAHAPGCFDPAFWAIYHGGMRPTVARAAVAVVPSEPVAAAARAAYGLPADRLRLIPVASEPARRFAGVEPAPVPGLGGRPFVLHLANAAPHKGARVVLRAAALLRDRLGPAAPAVVLCGVGTDRFRAAFADQTHPGWAYAAEVQGLWQRLGLREGVDVAFLGYRSDAEVAWLYERSAVVVNAAGFDNGSFNLTEGHYFGRPLVSTDYPAARALAARFRLPVRFVPLDDPAALATALAGAAAGPTRPGRLAAVRAALADPEFGEGRHADRVWAVLGELTGVRPPPPPARPAGRWGIGWVGRLSRR